MKKQYDMVRAKIPDAVFCTNLYGEILELYQEGCLKIPEDEILIWADNGYGKRNHFQQKNTESTILRNPDSRKKRVRKFCGAHKIKASQNLHKIIGTHLLTVLTTDVITVAVKRKP